MLKRVLTTVLAVPLFIYVLWYAPPYVFNGLVALVAVLGIREFQMMAEKVGSQGSRWIGWVGGVGVILGFWWHRLDYAFLVLVAVVAAGLVAHMLRRHPVNTALVSVSATTAGVVYIGVFLGYLVSLRTIEGGTTALSAQLLTFFFLVIFAGDSAAMLIGRRFGRHHLLPVISPKKTVEGSLGGLAGSLVGAALSHVWFFPQMPLSHALLLGLILGAVGQVGDWCESLLKRGSGLKDTSSLIPGHGGMLDRLDSLLFNAPILYYYYLTFLVR